MSARQLTAQWRNTTVSETAEPTDGTVYSHKPDIDSLVAALASPDRATRLTARETLVGVGHPAVAPLLPLLEDKHDHIRWEAAKTLAEIGDPAAGPALVKTLEDREAGVRWLAAEGLIKMRRACLKPLLHALTERADSVWLRNGAHHILHGLGKMGLADGMEPVLKALEDIEPAVTVPAAARRALDTL
jgi:HEAT repeat protein